MRTIGLLGGMSWESTVTYYQELNRGVRERLGGLHSAPCMLSSVDFAEVERMQERGAWAEAGQYLAEHARGLERGGAECVVLCTNTMHRVYDAIRDAVSIPVLHIADGTADPLAQAGYKTVGLLGTRYTMEQDFYRAKLAERGFTVLVPDDSQRELVHEIIYNELCLGEVLDHSREAYLKVVESLAQRGAEAVILGCTEIGLLLNKANCPLPVFDTTLLHVEAALDWALDEDGVRVPAGASLELGAVARPPRSRTGRPYRAAVARVLPVAGVHGRASAVRGPVSAVRDGPAR